MSGRKLTEYCQKVPCAACGGDGYTLTGTGVRWEANATYLGEPVGEPVPVPEPTQEPCQSCDCTGEVYIVPSNLLAELEADRDYLRRALERAAVRDRVGVCTALAATEDERRVGPIGEMLKRMAEGARPAWMQISELEDEVERLHDLVCEIHHAGGTSSQHLTQSGYTVLQAALAATEEVPA